MSIDLDEQALTESVTPLLDDPAFREGVRVLTSEPFFLAHFLASVSQGEALGESAVALIGQEELAQRIRDLERQEREERGHKEQTLEAATALFPEFFPGGVYRYRKALRGRPYYLAVLDANRARLKERARYSRLNLYLTTTLAYEIMVLLLYRAVADAVKDAPIATDTREHIAAVLERILAEEETHLGVVEQHNALLETPLDELSDEARAMLDQLRKLTAADYAYPADLAVRQVVAQTALHVDAARYRAEIEGS
jgi:hypothetical protein